MMSGREIHKEIYKEYIITIVETKSSRGDYAFEIEKEGEYSCCHGIRSITDGINIAKQEIDKHVEKGLKFNL